MSHAATHCLPYSVDLSKPIGKQYLNDLFVTDDNEAHQLDISLYRGNEKVTLPSNAAVIGYFIRYSDNTTLTLPQGTISGNVVSIMLSEACYALPGQFAVVVKVTEGGPVSTVFHAEGSMKVSKTDTVIDSGNVIPSLDELLAKIADMEAATTDGRAAAQEARDAAAEALAVAQTVQSIYEYKADAILDESARAASHELHAQRGPLAVTLYGKTTETGTGDKSPDNPYEISGVDAAQVHAGSKNLFSGAINVTSNATSVRLAAGTYTLSQESGTADAWYIKLKKNGVVVTGDKKIAGTAMSYSSSTNWYYSSAGRDSLTFTLDDSYEVLIAQLNADGTIDGMLNAGSTALAFEPYNANVITPPLLPDGAALMGNGTVDDTVENDVPSGCDCCVTFDGSDDEAWFLDAENVKTAFRFNGALPKRKTENGNIYSEIWDLYTNALPTEMGTDVNTMGIGTSCRGTSYSDAFIVLYPTGAFADLEAFKAHLAANPLTVYYKSTDYTPDKDFRVCRVTRKWKQIESYAGESVRSGYVSSTGGLDTGARVVYPLATPGVYYTDPYTLRKPDTLESKTVTVTGSAETAVTYPHDTKHYIDSKISELVTLALANQ